MQKIMALDSISTVIHVSQFVLNCFEIVSYKFSFYNFLLILLHTNFAEKLLTLDCGLNVFKKCCFFFLRQSYSQRKSSSKTLERIRQKVPLHKLEERWKKETEQGDHW